MKIELFKFIGLFIAILGFSCSSPNVVQHEPIPLRDGAEFFDWLQQHQGIQRSEEIIAYMHSISLEKIENGTHSQILIKNNQINDKNGKWGIKFPFRVFPIFENSLVLVLESGSQLDHIRIFRKNYIQYWVIRKKDGVILDSLQPKMKQIPSIYAVLNDKLYLYEPDDKILFKLNLK